MTTPRPGHCPKCGGWLSDDPKLSGLTCICLKPTPKTRKNGTENRYNPRYEQ